MTTACNVIVSTLALYSAHNRLQKMLAQADALGLVVDIARTVGTVTRGRDGLKSITMGEAYEGGYTCIRAEGTDAYFTIRHRVPVDAWGEYRQAGCLGELSHSDTE